MASSNETKCSNCNNPAEEGKLKKCSSCQSAWYCSVDCQRANWATHKSACKSESVRQMISAVGSSDGDTVRRLAKTKRVLNGRIDYTPPKRNPDDDPEPRTLERWTALHECVRTANLEMMQILIDNGANVNITDADGETPVFVASTSGDASVVKLLLLAGANPNSKAGDGWSCLMMASRDGDYDVVKALLDGGADLHDGHDMFGRNAMDMVDQMRSGQGARMVNGETHEQACARYEALYDLLSDYA